MAGQIKVMIDRIISERSKGNSTLAITTRTKLILKGIEPDQYTSASPDDPMIIARLREVADELNVTL
jgi:hypothetical protein